MSFEALLTPKSVAVIGASTSPRKVGCAVLANLKDGGYEGAIYPVNPKAEAILDLSCFSSVSSIPGPVELAVIVTGREAVIPVLKECAAKAVKAVIIITAGFGEIGAEGRAQQEEIGLIARHAGITLLGPNCLGLVNPWHKLNAAFGQSIDRPGHIGLVSQSGALITSIQDWAAANHVGFSVLASIGNKAALDEVDFLHTLQKDKNTKVIAAYLEDISNGQEFMRVAERVGKVKPIVVLKAGKTTSGAKAASSHTGSLAGSDRAYDCAFERSGVIRAGSIERLFDVATALACQPLPRGNRVAVVTNAGGPGIMMTDALESLGLAMANLSESTRARLAEMLPSAASVRNPVDVLGDADGNRYGAAVETLLSSEEIDALVVVLTPQKMTECVATAEKLVALSKKQDKPVHACFMGAASVADGVRVLQAGSIPQYTIPERAAAAILETVNYGRYKKRPLRVVERFAVNKNPIHRIFRSYRDRGLNEVGEFDAKTILKAYNFVTPPGILAKSVDEAVRFCEETGYPVAMKISSPDILHKSDVGGVRVKINSADEVADAFELMMLRIGRKMPGAELRGVLVEKMVDCVQEVILGMKKDPQFGPMLMFGLGGIFVEVLKDVTFSLAPVTAEEARLMLERTRSYKLLTGVRGRAGVDLDAIVENLQRLSQLVLDFAEIDEVDINPLMVGHEGDGAFVVDARIIIGKE